MRFTIPSTLTFRAFTLVELLIALALSLLLLLAMTELFSRVGGVMNDTRATLNMTTNLDGVEFLLRQDLDRIPLSLLSKPMKIARGEFASDFDGYLEVIEGPDIVSDHSYVNEDDKADPTVGDVDDILGFTAEAETGIPFRGIIGNQIAERNAADITWFVRGNTLYRRVRLIDDQRTDQDGINSIDDLARREKRYGHDGAGDHETSPNSLNTFPYPLYDDNVNEGWSYLRMPTLEETLHDAWNDKQWRLQPIDTDDRIATPDLWTQPHFLSSEVQDRKSGSLRKYVASPRHHRAGEDIVLTNVLSFDIKVWDPKTKNFVDLGAENTQWDLDTADPTLNKQPELNVPKTIQPKPWRTWDSWTSAYTMPAPNVGQIEPPPYDKPLTAVQFTIRCFDPISRSIKQISVVHRFDEN